MALSEDLQYGFLPSEAEYACCTEQRPGKVARGLAFRSCVLRISFKGYVDVSTLLQFHFVALLIR